MSLILSSVVSRLSIASDFIEVLIGVYNSLI
jgi:hypothetical protein